MKPMFLDSFCVPQFIITAAASDFVPLGPILLLKPTHKGPKHNQANAFCLFVYILLLRLLQPQTACLLVLQQNAQRERSDRATKRPIDRATDRPIQRPSDRAIDRAINPLNNQGLELYSK